MEHGPHVRFRLYATGIHGNVVWISLIPLNPINDKRKMTMTMYHIKKDGTPAVCKAKPGHCPVSSGGEHFTDIATANKVGERMVEVRNSLIGNREPLNQLSRGKAALEGSGLPKSNIFYVQKEDYLAPIDIHNTHPRTMSYEMIGNALKNAGVFTNENGSITMSTKDMPVLSETMADTFGVESRKGRKAVSEALSSFIKESRSDTHRKNEYHPFTQEGDTLVFNNESGEQVAKEITEGVRKRLRRASFMHGDWIPSNSRDTDDSEESRERKECVEMTYGNDWDTQMMNGLGERLISADGDNDYVNVPAQLPVVVDSQGEPDDWMTKKYTAGALDAIGVPYTDDEYKAAEEGVREYLRGHYKRWDDFNKEHGVSDDHPMDVRSLIGTAMYSVRHYNTKKNGKPEA